MSIVCALYTICLLLQYSNSVSTVKVGKKMAKARYVIDIALCL